MILLNAGDDVRIEILRLSPIPDEKDLFAIADLDQGLPSAATKKKGNNRKRAETKNESAQPGLAEIKLHCVFRHLRNAILQKKQWALAIYAHCRRGYFPSAAALSR